MDEKRIIEINGIKLEVDLTNARRVDTFRVGDQVKVMKNGDQYSSTKVFPGIITSLDNFKDSPCITVAYYESNYGTPTISFLYYTKDTKGYEIVLSSEDEITVTGDGIIERFEQEIRKKENETAELRAKLEYFKKYFMNRC